MIFEAIINWFLRLATYLFSLFPDVAISVSPESIGQVTMLLSKVGCIVPVDTFVYMCATWVVLQNFDIAVSSFNWFIKKIPGVE